MRYGEQSNGTMTKDANGWCRVKRVTSKTERVPIWE